MQRRRFGTILLIVVAIIAVLAILVTQLTARASVVSADKGFSLDEGHAAAYTAAVNDYYGIHPAERLRFLLSTQNLALFLTDRYPEVLSVKVGGVKDVVETELAVTFRHPVAGWQIRDKQYYVDSEGVVFEKNYFGVPPVQIVDESGITPEEGTTVASSRLLGFLGKVVSASKGRGYTALQAVLPAETTRRLDIRFENVGPIIRFSTDRGAGEQVEDMTRSLKYMADHSIGASYLDVRVAGRAVYR